MSAAAAIRRLVATHAPEWPGATVVPLGQGLDHATYLVDDDLVVRVAKSGDASHVDAEARLLRVVADISPLPVPEPVFAVPEDGCLAYRRLPGIPLLDVAPERRAPGSRVVAGAVGRLLSALHTSSDERLTELVEVDEAVPKDWLREAAEVHAAVASAIPWPHRPALEAFLTAPPPDECDRRVFSHNDLGIEHVLVDPDSFEVTGVIDWSDAAVVDPACDFGLLLRDLGPAALDAALAAYATDPENQVTLRARALFYARCAVLEDLAFGQEHEQAAYTDKSLAGLAWLFPGD